MPEPTLPAAASSGSGSRRLCLFKQPTPTKTMACQPRRAVAYREPMASRRRCWRSQPRRRRPRHRRHRPSSRSVACTHPHPRQPGRDLCEVGCSLTRSVGWCLGWWVSVPTDRVRRRENPNRQHRRCARIRTAAPPCPRRAPPARRCRLRPSQRVGCRPACFCGAWRSGWVPVPALAGCSSAGRDSPSCSATRTACWRPAAVRPAAAVAAVVAVAVAAAAPAASARPATAATEAACPRRTRTARACTSFRPAGCCWRHRSSGARRLPAARRLCR